MTLVLPNFRQAFSDLNGPDIRRQIARTEAVLKSSQERIAASERGTLELIEERARDRECIKQCRETINRGRVVP